MGRLPRSETTKRWRQLARNHVDMERGTYPWPDGRAHRNRDGEPQVIFVELLRSVDYNPKYSVDGKSVFEHPTYAKIYAAEKARRDMVFSKELAKKAPVYTEIAERMRSEVLRRVRDEADLMESELLLRALPVVEKLAAEAEGRKPPEKKSGRIENLMIAINNKIPDDQRRGLLAEIEGVLDEKLDSVRAAIGIGGDEIIDADYEVDERSPRPARAG